MSKRNLIYVKLRIKINEIIENNNADRIIKMLVTA